MPKSTTYKPASGAGLPKGVVPPSKEIRVAFPKKPTGAGSLGASALSGWVATQRVPTAPKNPTVAVKAVPVTAKGLGQLQLITDSPTAPGEMLNRMDTETFVGTLYTALVAAQYLKALGAYDKVASRHDPEVDAEWEKVLAGHIRALAAGGIKEPTQQRLDAYVKTLSANPTNLNAVMRIANSAVPQGSGASLGASFVPDVRVLPGDIIATFVPNLCSTPFASGTFTRHFHQGFSWQITIPYPCFDWCHKSGIPYPCNFRICNATVTLAAVSFDLDLSVAYKVDCCGATASGQASVQACGTVVNISSCATCTATIVGVAGVARTPNASGCVYGLGVTASLQCQVAGHTVFFASVPFGWAVTGPCPPAGIKC